MVLSQRKVARMEDEYKPIEDHGIIGDLNTVALVATDGCIDFLCLPDFDSPTVFASLLDANRGGKFWVRPVIGNCRQKQMYLPDTNILLTRFLSEQAVIELIDFMPLGADEQSPKIIRILRSIRGEAKCELACLPRFNYAQSSHRSKQVNECHVEFTSENPSDPILQLLGSVPLRLNGRDAAAEISLTAGQTETFVLQCGPVDDRTMRANIESGQRSFDDTSAFWHTWIKQSTYTGRWREMVNRSALVLKLLTSRKYGSMVAAPTFGLPEQIGGERNWDYRYTWIRDAAFTIDAFLGLGFREEAHAFRYWLDGPLSQPRSGKAPLQIMYRINGESDLEEASLNHLQGYKGSSPVRIGNGASKQLQLDIYGELMSALYYAARDRDEISHDGWIRICTLVDWLGQNWLQPDDGIWEVRGGPQQFLHSRVMCWVAVDRALRLAQLRSLPASSSKWEDLRSHIYDDIFGTFWDPEVQAFVASAGSKMMDASTLLMPLMHVISPVDPLWLATLKKIEGDLVCDPLVHRYDTRANHSDGLKGSEGSFAACSFWYVECLARANQLDKARLLFEKTISYSNHLGLYAEEIGTSGEHLGNFPQAFTHLSLVSAALYLNQALDRQ